MGIHGLKDPTDKENAARAVPQIIETTIFPPSGFLNREEYCEQLIGVLPENNIDKMLVERGTRYGKFEEHARITQAIKAAMADSPNWATLPQHMKESLEMNAHKIGRILNGDPYYDDSWQDMIGYTKLVLDKIHADSAAKTSEKA